MRAEEEALPVGVDRFLEHHARRAVQPATRSRARRRLMTKVPSGVEQGQPPEIDFLLEDVLGPLGPGGDFLQDDQAQAWP